MKALHSLHSNNRFATGWMVPLICLAVIIGLPMITSVWMDLQPTTDYSTHPPQQVFQNVTGVDPEPGIRNLRVAGHSGFMGLKHWVWITFDTTEAAMTRITRGEAPLDPATAARITAQDYAGSKRFKRQDQHLVGWDDLAPVRKREVYVVSGGKPNSSFVWAGYLILDRERGCGFIHASGD